MTWAIGNVVVAANTVTTIVVVAGDLELFPCTVSTVNNRRSAKRWTSGQLSNIKCERLLFGNRVTPNVFVRPQFGSIHTWIWLSNSTGMNRMHMAYGVIRNAPTCRCVIPIMIYTNGPHDNTKFIYFENIKTWALFNGNVYQKQSLRFRSQRKTAIKRQEKKNTNFYSYRSLGFQWA